MKSLPLFHRIAGQPVIVLGSGAIAQPKQRLVERAGGYVIGDLQEGIDKGARLAFIALEDDTAAQDAAARLRSAGLLVNAVDRPDLCDFTTPSLLDRDPVLIAIGTSGASAGLAKQLRLRLETLLPQTLGALADRLFGARAALRKAFPDTGQRRRALDDVLGEGGALDPFDGNSADRVDGWLGNPYYSAQDRRVEITLTSDDPEDLTLRQARLLGSADAILFDPAVPAAILDRARADAMRWELPVTGPDPDGLVVLLQRR